MGSMFARRHYEAIARLIDTIDCNASSAALERERSYRSKYARALAFLFRSDNPRFDEERFYKACGLDRTGV